MSAPRHTTPFSVISGADCVKPANLRMETDFVSYTPVCDVQIILSIHYTMKQLFICKCSSYWEQSEAECDQCNKYFSHLSAFMYKGSQLQCRILISDAPGEKFSAGRNTFNLVWLSQRTTLPCPQGTLFLHDKRQHRDVDMFQEAGVNKFVPGMYFRFTAKDLSEDVFSRELDL